MRVEFFAFFGLLMIGTAPAFAEGITVDFKFDSSSKCSRISPEIHIGSIPSGTAMFSVRLKDDDAPSWRHGGGKVPDDGSGVIAKGALTDRYNGPCPPDGSHNYRFIVKALDANGDELAEGEATQRFP